MFPQVQQAVRANYMQGYEITERMRALLIDWLVQVHSRFQLLQETLYLTVAILDRFLQVGTIQIVVWVSSDNITNKSTLYCRTSQFPAESCSLLV